MKRGTALNNSARKQLFQLNIHKQPWEIFPSTTQNLILKIIHLKSSWFSAFKFPFKLILPIVLVFQSTFPSFALGQASISPHLKSIIHQHSWAEEPANSHWNFKAGGCQRAGKVEALCCVGVTFPTPQVSSVLGADQTSVGIKGAAEQRIRDRKGRKMGGSAGEDNKGLTLLSGDNVEKQQPLRAQTWEGCLGNTRYSWCSPKSPSKRAF